MTGSIMLSPSLITCNRFHLPAVYMGAQLPCDSTIGQAFDSPAGRAIGHRSMTSKSWHRVGWTHDKLEANLQSSREAGA